MTQKNILLGFLKDEMTDNASKVQEWLRKLDLPTHICTLCRTKEEFASAYGTTQYDLYIADRDMLSPNIEEHLTHIPHDKFIVVNVDGMLEPHLKSTTVRYTQAVVCQSIFTSMQFEISKILNLN
ncbi:hypothetical protein KBC03_02135 [Patescibacteria group bacterium]|nr:hypothetical protein [Patescibacteria group bacterium]